MWMGKRVNRSSGVWIGDGNGPLQELDLVVIYFEAVGHADVRHMGMAGLVAERRAQVVVVTDPRLLRFVWEPALPNAVAGNLTHVTWVQLPGFAGNAVLLHQRFLCEERAELKKGQMWPPIEPSTGETCKTIAGIGVEKRVKGIFETMPVRMYQHWDGGWTEGQEQETHVALILGP